VALMGDQSDIRACGFKHGDPLPEVPEQSSIRWVNADNDHTIVQLTRDDFARLQKVAPLIDGDLAARLDLIVAWFDGMGLAKLRESRS